MISFNLVPNNAAASAVFVEQEPVNRGTGSPVIPHKILILGQYNAGKSPTVNTPQIILSKADAWDRYGRGSMLSIMIEAAMKRSGTVPIYALPVADDGGAGKASGQVAVTGPATAAGTFAFYIAGQLVSVAVTAGMTANQLSAALTAAVNAKLDLPAVATDEYGTVDIECRWAGASGNQISLEMNLAAADATPAGFTVVVTDMASGATDPVLTTALANLGDTWYTEIANPYTENTPLTAIEAAGEARVDPGVKRPFAAFTGYTDTASNFLTFLASRNSQWNTMVPVHGSPTPAYEIAAGAAGMFAAVQQSTPGRPCKGLTIPGVLANIANDLTYTSRNAIVLAGGSHTYNQGDGTVTVGDLVTTKTTEGGADTDDWRFSIIIPNLQFKIYAIETTFRGAPFDRAIVLADGDPPGPTYGVRPSTVKAYAINLVDNWVARGLSTSRDQIVEGIIAEIDGSNAGRINLAIPDVPSAGLRVLAAKLEWAFLV